MITNCITDVFPSLLLRPVTPPGVAGDTGAPGARAAVAASLEVAWEILAGVPALSGSVARVKFTTQCTTPKWAVWQIDMAQSLHGEQVFHTKWVFIQEILHVLLLVFIFVPML